MSELLKCLEICAGAGGQSLGLEKAGFQHAAAVEIDHDAAETLRLNRPHWNPVELDVRKVSGADYQDIDLLAGGVPCPPFSIAGQQLGAEDERDLFPEALRLVKEIEPEAVMLENVRGLASARFTRYRECVLEQLEGLGYVCSWQVLNASEYGVPQLRPRFILVALKSQYGQFKWPQPVGTPPTVGETLGDSMGARSWSGAEAWAAQANGIGPTVVGGSRKHGGPDLGPTRARAAWGRLGVDGRGIANQAPGPDDGEDHVPRLTNEMVARLQGFPSAWRFAGRKTSIYRQIGNAFPPPVAAAVGGQIRVALEAL